jgi:hypothetical protein
MPDYSKSKIYRIVCNETGETYYGSTTQTLARRLSCHKSDAKNRLHPCYSKQIIERGNYDIVLCEECPCENKEQLHAIERKWVEENECVNKHIPCRSPQEYQKTNNAEIKQQKKIYYQANKEEIKDKVKLYRDTHKEEKKQKDKIYRDTHKEQIKEWREANRDQLLEKKKLYREAQKQLKEKQLE